MAKQSHLKPRTPEQVLKRIMNDFSAHQARSKDAFEVTQEMPKYFSVTMKKCGELFKITLHILV